MNATAEIVDRDISIKLEPGGREPREILIPYAVIQVLVELDKSGELGEVIESSIRDNQLYLEVIVYDVL